MTALVPNLDNIKLGSCNVSWNASSLGYTMGGVDVTVKTTTKTVSVDQFGDTAIDEYIQGRTITVKVPMAEQDLQKLVSVIPGATLVTDSTTPTKMKIVAGTGVGLSLRSLAAPLVLTPQSSTETANDSLTIPLAACSGDMEFAYEYDKQRVFSVTFTGYPDNTTGELYVMGDSTAMSS